jgi:heat shock protein HslJ
MRIPLWTLLLAAAAIAACGKAGAPPPAAPGPAATPPAGAPTLAEAGAATYSGIEEAGTDVTLAGGQWEGPPFREGAVSRPAVGLIDDLLLEGDLDGDGGDEAIVMLWSGSGGSGTRSHVAVLDRVDGQVVNVATRLLGDRVQLRGITLDAGIIRLDVVSTGPQDAACCPGDLASLAWRLGQGGLEDAEPPRVSGRLGLAALEGSAWRLARLAWSEPAPPSPEVTLTWTEGRFAGNAGCNEYRAGARDDGEMPGGIVLDPPAATRKTCPPEVMQVEERFLAQLGAVRRLGFMSGRLMLDDQGGAGMLFDRIETVATP